MTDLKSFALELGFDDFGVANATFGTPNHVEFEEAIDENRHGPLDYLERTRAERADVQKLMPGDAVWLHLAELWDYLAHTQELTA